MTSLLTQALKEGFKPKQIIQFILKQFPEHRKKIETAMTMGYGADKILQMLSKDKKGVPQIDDSMLTESEKGSEIEEIRRQNINKRALQVAGGAVALAAPMLLPRAGAAIAGALSEKTPSPMDETPGQVIAQEVNQPGKIPNVPVPPQQQIQVPIDQTEVDTNPKYQPEYDFLEKRKLIIKMQTMAKAGKSPKEIAEMLKKKLPMMEQEYIRSLGGGEGSLDDKLLDIANKFTQPTGIIQKQVEKLPKLTEQSETEPTNLVLTKAGDLGDIKGADAKGLLINVDGKVHKYGDQDVIESPLPQKDLATLYEDLIQGIPEKARSSMINMAGYDPESKEFIFIPHSGDIYRYDDIPEEFAKKLEQVMFRAKTTGENFYGSWSEGEESRGAGLSGLIKELQKYYGGKGKEYSRKYKKIFDLLELPKQAVREKYAKRKKEK